MNAALLAILFLWLVGAAIAYDRGEARND